MLKIVNTLTITLTIYHTYALKDEVELTDTDEEILTSVWYYCDEDDD